MNHALCSIVDSSTVLLLLAGYTSAAEQSNGLSFDPCIVLHSADPASSTSGRQLRSIRQSLTTDAMKTLVYAFVSSRIDYCNSILAGVSGQLLQRLQSVQNAAARLVTGARRSDRSHDAYSTPTALATNTPANYFQDGRTVIQMSAWHGSAILSTYCEPTSSHSDRCHLRSAESGQLTVPRTRTNYGDRSFAIHAPIVWNSLPADLRLLNISLPVFRKRLKMCLF